MAFIRLQSGSRFFDGSPFRYCPISLSVVLEMSPMIKICEVRFDLCAELTLKFLQSHLKRGGYSWGRSRLTMTGVL